MSPTRHLSPLWHGTGPRHPRRLAHAVALTGVLIAASATPAHAVPGEGWERAEDPSILSMLLVYVAIPGAAAALITLLVVMPSLARGTRGGDGSSRGEAAWFGGPRRGADEANAADLESSERGGAGARW